MSAPKVIVVGGGLAGLMTTIKICELGTPVQLFSYVPARRSHSVCAQGGINASIDVKGEGDSPDVHFDETIYGGDFLANQPPVKGMCYFAPEIVYMLDRMGLPFNRTPEGNLDFRRFGGTLFHRTAFAGATTGQQMMYALDEQVRRFEAEGLVERFEYFSFLGLLLDEQARARGITALDLATMEVRAYPAEAVVIATGGPGLIFGKTTNSMTCTGSASARCLMQGAKYANGEFIQVHPTAIPGGDKRRLISESVRGEGGRVWTYKDGRKWYFLEEMFPAYGNLVPRDIASRTIFDVCVNQKLGINGENYVYLDVTHLPKDLLKRKLGGVLEIYEKFTGEDPYTQPMKVFPAVHYSMGGLWVDYSQMTNLKGLYAVGECDYQYHGANRLGANSLLSCIYAGMVAGPRCVDYVNGEQFEPLSDATMDAYVGKENEELESIFSLDGEENAYKLQDEMAEMMVENVTVVRFNEKLKSTLAKLRDLEERAKRIGITDHGRRMNQEVLFVRELRDRLLLARIITEGALLRNESRGAHYKPEFPKRNDEEWLKTTIAEYSDGAVKFSYEPVDVSLIPPRERRYDVKIKS